MPTLSPLSQTQSSAERLGKGDAPEGSLVAIVHKQLVALESLAAEGRAEATLLHTEIADLSTRLSATTARLARLEGTLASTERVLVAIRTGLLTFPAQQPETAQPSTSQPTINGEESRLTIPTPAPGAPTAALQPTQPSVAPTGASSEVVPVAYVAPVNPPAPRPERVAPSISEAQPEPERVAARVLPPTAPATPPQPASVLPPVVPASQASEQVVPDEPDSGPQIQRGSKVEVVFDDDTTGTYTIVRQSEANLSRKLIGENTPLGQALLGARVGDIRRYRVANNPESTVQVRAIA